jgi:hypothetical protein
MTSQFRRDAQGPNMRQTRMTGFESAQQGHVETILGKFHVFVQQRGRESLHFLASQTQSLLISIS